MKKIFVCFAILVGIDTSVSAQTYVHRAPLNCNPTCNEGAMRLYPATANSYVNIYVDWNELQPFTVYVCKDDNEIVTQWQGDTKKNYQKALYTNKMGPGNYYIKIKSPKSEMSEAFSIAH